MDDADFLRQYLGQEDSYRRYFQDKLRELGRLGPPGRLLDVGCGPGILLGLARQAGWQVVGLDRSRAAAAEASRRGLEVVADLPPGPFDAATLFQSVEHLRDPPALLRELFVRMRPGGVLMLTTPDGQGLLARLMGRFWFGLRNPEHLHVFTRATLEDLVRGTGFEVLSCRTEWGRQLDAAYVAERLEGYYGWRGLPRWKRLTFREPWVNLYLVARRPLPGAGAQASSS